MHTIYLDHATTTPLAASVREAMLPFLQNMFGHPASNHWMGRVAAEAIEDARSSVASLLSCHPSEVIFTSGATESINLALLGAGRAIQKTVQQPHCITTNLEHAAVRLTVAQLEREGWTTSVVACDEQGVVTAEAIAELLKPDTRLLTITHASCELGTIQPINEIAALCQERDVIIHVDSAQTVGKIELSPDELGVDLMSFTGHKFYGPKGVGGLYIRQGVRVEPLLFGEGSEAGLRPGTPPVALVAGLGQAAKLAHAGLASSVDRVTELRDRFCGLLESLIKQPLTIHGNLSRRVPGIVSLQLPDVSALELQSRLPEICFGPVAQRQLKQASGSATIWQSLGLSPMEIASTIRISLGWSTSADEISEAAQMIATAYESLR